LSGNKKWKERCQKSVHKEKTSKDKSQLNDGFEINCEFLCRIGQGGKACLCA
jgi:hypothetical protein